MDYTRNYEQVDFDRVKEAKFVNGILYFQYLTDEEYKARQEAKAREEEEENG